MQFIARNRRAFSDVTQRHINIELRQRLLHQPRVRHEFLFGLCRLDRHIRQLQKIERRQLVITYHWRLRHRNPEKLYWLESEGDNASDYVRLGFFLNSFSNFSAITSGLFVFLCFT